jgi:cytochrome P450
MGAGSLTTALFLKVTNFHLLKQSDVLAKLRAELETAFPDPTVIPPLIELEKLPYLQAVVKEGQRLSYGVAHRLQRIAPTEALAYKDWAIPPGTPVSMTAVYIHQDPSIFPDPFSFKPERWLASDAAKLDKYLVNFGRGTRQCLGINLANLEMFTTLATMVRRFEMELYQTAESDVELRHDFFNPLPRLDSKGVRVLVK